MRIALASYQSLMLIRGGPHVKLIQTLRHLKKLNVDVEYYDMWKSGDELLKYDLIHLFGCNMEISSLARNFKLRGLRYVVNPIFFTRRSTPVIRLSRMIQKTINRIYQGVYNDFGLVEKLCRESELVLPNTIAEGELIEKGLGIDIKKIHVIHNGVSEEFENGDPDLFYKQYGVKDFILNVGHIGPPRKNTLALVRALSSINHPAVIIGRSTPGDETDAILKESKLNKNLLLIFGIDNQSPLLASAYAACRLFVLPSLFETPGRAALEAGLAGAPVVITPYGGTKECFQDLAEYVDPYSVRDISRGIEKVLNKPKNLKLQRHIRENFIWPVIARQTAEMYDRVLKT
jgi:glycosyltransferase involved in cell wall biosynthesis